ncbi:MAG: hypothetical protein AB7P02_04670 [Alphaproteobacteria bacterium]
MKPAHGGVAAAFACVAAVGDASAYDLCVVMPSTSYANGVGVEVGGLWHQFSNLTVYQPKCMATAATGAVAARQFAIPETRAECAGASVPAGQTTSYTVYVSVRPDANHTPLPIVVECRKN